MIEGHGDDAYRYGKPIVANFSSNVYGRVNLDGLKQYICENIDKIGSYPEPEPYGLERGLAAHHRLCKGEVLVTNGATEAIYLTAQTFAETNTAILQPTFSEYADACRLHRHKVQSLYSLPDEREDLLLPEDIRMLWLCNPNNPTGTVLSRDYLKRLAEKNPQVCFVFDQSYEAFTRKILFSPAEAAEYPNILLLHSMTKRYAIPGLRLGYVTGQKGLLDRIRTHRMPWSVNKMAVAAGEYLLQQGLETPFELTECLDEAGWLKEELSRKCPVEVWDSDTHFMLVRLRMGSAAALKDYLAEEHGLLIRNASNFEGLNDSFFRIAAQGHDENVKLVEAISRWFE